MINIIYDNTWNKNISLLMMGGHGGMAHIVLRRQLTESSS